MPAEQTFEPKKQLLFLLHEHARGWDIPLLLRASPLQTHAQLFTDAPGQAETKVGAVASLSCWGGGDSSNLNRPREAEPLPWDGSGLKPMKTPKTTGEQKLQGLPSK